MGDTYLDVSSWGKGLVWVNGNCLGRYWNIGPTQTMYVPAPWLKKGENGVAENAIDGQTFNHWHTLWSSMNPDYPHVLVIDLGEETALSGFTYVPRMDENSPGRIKDYKIYLGNELVKK